MTETDRQHIRHIIDALPDEDRHIARLATWEWTQEAISQAIGRSQQHVSNRLAALRPHFATFRDEHEAD